MDAERLTATVAAAKRGRPEAYEALMHAYGPRLYGYFRRATSSHHEAEDLLGELWLRLVRMLGKYEESGRFDQWLFRIAANMVRDRYRRGKTHPAPLSIDAEGDDESPMTARLSGDGPGVDEGLVRGEMRFELERALASLDETTRQMVLLRHYGEMSFKDIAKTFGCPLGTALAKVHRGMKALRQAMETTDEQRSERA